MKSHRSFTVAGIVLLVAASILFVQRSVFCQTTRTANGLNYLKSTQNADGSWRSTSTSLNDVFPTTAEALGALRTVEATTSSNQTNAIQFLSSQTVDANPFLAARIIVLAGTS